ncbi:MAG: cation:proton antiporter, partial [Spirochaetota bacterium]|nr:cation:proton antiporter [Spirochaetota bacterium]
MTHNFIQLIILIIGTFLLLALASGKLVSLMKIPKVTGYLLVGLVFASLSPELLGAIFPNYQHIKLQISIGSESQPITIMDMLKVIKNIGLGLIVFNIGGEFQLENFKQLGKKVVWISFFEILFTSVIVSILCFICFVALFDISLSSSISYSILLGIIAIATAPAATLLVLREYESEGPVTNHILVLIGLNNIVCILIFKIVFSGFISESQDFAKPMIEVIVSIGLGILVGLIISLVEKWLEKPVELLMLVLGGITINIGLAYLIHHSFNVQLSNLLANLFMGIALINSTTKGTASFKALKNADLPIYAIFFVLAGA